MGSIPVTFTVFIVLLVESTSAEQAMTGTEDCYSTAYINITFLSEKDGRAKFIEKAILGKFADGFQHSVRGVIVHVESGGTDDTGCSLPWVIHPPHSQPWIALLKRGSCTFQTKLDNALKNNASGIIVYNDGNSSSLDKMKLTPRSSDPIGAVSIYKWKGEELARLLDNRTRVMAHITVANTCSKSQTSLNRTSVLLVSISFIVLMIISLAWLVFYYVQRFRYVHAKDRLSRRLCTAAKKALARIPTKNIKAGDKELEGDGDSCAICIELYKPSDVVRNLPCSHEYHKQCIDPWLLEHRTCPMCKMDILKHYGFALTGSQESMLQVDNEERLSEDDSFQPQNAVVENHMSIENAFRSAANEYSYSLTVNNSNGGSEQNLSQAHVVTMPVNI